MLQIQRIRNAFVHCPMLNSLCNNVICSRQRSRGKFMKLPKLYFSNFKWKLSLLIALFKYNVWILLDILVLIFDIFDVWYFKTKSCSISIRLFFDNYMKIFSFWLALYNISPNDQFNRSTKLFVVMFETLTQKAQYLNVKQQGTGTAQGLHYINCSLTGDQITRWFPPGLVIIRKIMMMNITVYRLVIFTAG